MSRLHNVPQEEARIREILSARLDFDPAGLDKPVRQFLRAQIEVGTKVGANLPEAAAWYWTSP